jgi:GNAT superfamily N-acetyltransferase
MSVEIKEVTSKKELKQFVKFSHKLYKGNPYYVPGLIEEEMMTLDKVKNPAFEVCDAIYYLAYKDGEIAGRIAGIINRSSNEVWKEKKARFGFVDFIDDNEVVDALFGAVEKWAHEQGMEDVQGPLGFTDMDHEGMLIEGFDQLGTMATIYNYPYYPKHMERLGYIKDQDWCEYKIYIPESVPEKHLRIGEIVMKRFGLKIMKFKNAKEIMPYAKNVFHTLNAAYAPLYGFAPLTEKQIDYYVNMYIPMLRFEMVTLIVKEADNSVAGFGISLPSLSRAMQKADGHLFPFGWIPLLKALKSKPKVIDLYLTGVMPEYQNKGVNALLFNDLIPVYQRLGVVYAETNPELETNNAVQAQWEYFKREHHKTRRAFTKKIVL